VRTFDSSDYKILLTMSHESTSVDKKETKKVYTSISFTGQCTEALALYKVRAHAVRSWVQYLPRDRVAQHDVSCSSAYAVGTTTLKSINLNYNAFMIVA
jgi:hypothetical protein